MANKRLKRLCERRHCSYTTQSAMVSETSSSSEREEEEKRKLASKSKSKITIRARSPVCCYNKTEIVKNMFSFALSLSFFCSHLFYFHSTFFSSCVFVARNIFSVSFLFSLRSWNVKEEEEKSINRMSVDNVLQCTLSDFDFPSLFWRRKWDLAIAEYDGTHCETSGSIVRTTNQRCARRSASATQMTSIECSVSFLM